MKAHGGTRSSIMGPMIVMGLTIMLALIAGLAPAASPVSADPPAPVRPPESTVQTTNMAEIELAATPDTLTLLTSMGITTRDSTQSGYVLADATGEQQGILKQHNIAYKVSRSFIQVDGGPGLNYAWVPGENSTDYNISDYHVTWDPLSISGIPADNYVAGVDIHVIIRHTYVGDLTLDVHDPGFNVNPVIWNREGGSTHDIDKWWTTLTAFNGLQGNGWWWLDVTDNAGGDTGYIEDWYMRVYYGPVSTPTPTATCAVSYPSPYEARVNAGGSNYADIAGHVWTADREFHYCTAPYWGTTGGQTYSNLQPIAGTTDDPLYQTQRYFPADAGYLFWVPFGMYQVDLKFAEIYGSSLPGGRVFDVRAEGQTVAYGIDVLQRAGALNKAYDLSFTVPVTDGKLDIVFVRNRDKDAPFVSAVRVLQISSDVPTPTPTPTQQTSPPGAYAVNLLVTEDTYTNQGNGGANNNLAPELYAGYQKELRAWLKFDPVVAGIPSNAVVSQADLMMYYLGQPGGDVSLDVYTPGAGWSANTLVWNNQPSFNTPAASNHWVSLGNPGYIAWNVTSLFQAWVNGSQVNNGVMVTDHNDTNSARIASRENPGWHPEYIHVSFTVPPSGPTWTPTGTATLTPTNSPTRTATPTATATSVPGTVALALQPATGTYGVGQIFTADIVVQAGSQPVDSAQAFLNFNPSYFAVVDSAGNPTSSIIQGSAFTVHLVNSADNATGQINYADGQLTGSPPSGSFVLATIRFKAKAAVASTTVAFNLAAPRQTKLIFGGANVLGATTNGQYAISISTSLAGTILLQGRPNPPGSLLAVPVTVQFFSPGSATVVMSTAATADANGAFTVAGVPTGAWDVAVKNAQTLSSKKFNVVFGSGSTAVNFGTLKEGDVNNDDIVDISDFSILRTTFLKSCGASGWDGRADFNADCIVDISDFSLLRTNFLVAGPVIVP